jgi:ABC-2 type transport system permease protein
VTGVLAIARTHLVTALRERVTLFWFLIFPVFLLLLLAAVFGDIAEQGAMQFDIALIDLEGGAEGSFSDLVVGLFEGMAGAQDGGQQPLFRLARPRGDEDPAAFLEEQLGRLRQGERAAVVVVPAGFSEGIARRLRGTAAAVEDGVGSSGLTIHYSRGTVASEIAASILEQMLAGVDREILRQAGRLDEEASIATATTWVGGSEASETGYVDFLLPGIILMGFFTNGLFGIPGSILFARDRRVLRRYWVTPLSVARYLTGLSIGHLTLCAIQFILLYVIGRYALGASVSFARPAAIGFLALGAATFMALGFLIASVAKTAQAGMAMANVLNMPLMFLSGLFFPVVGLPAFLVVIIRINPLTYLAEGLRSAVGVQMGTTSTVWLVVVPLLWIAVAAGLSARRLRWDVGR